MNSNRRHGAGSATAKQTALLNRLCAERGLDLAKEARAYGASDFELRHGLSKFMASRIIGRLLETPSAGGECDPGELAADRWAESQVGL